MAVSIERLAAIRNKNNVSKSTLAKVIGLSKSLITLAEKKKEHEFKFSDGIVMCKYLNISPEYLLSYIDNESPYIYANIQNGNTVIYDKNDKILTTNPDSEFNKINYVGKGTNNLQVLNKSINQSFIEYIAAFNSTSHIAIKSKKNELKNRVRAGDVMIFDQHKKSETGDDVLLSNKSDNEIIGTIGWMHDNSIAIDINDERMIIDNNDGDVKILVLVAIIPHAGIRRTNVD